MESLGIEVNDGLSKKMPEVTLTRDRGWTVGVTGGLWGAQEMGVLAGFVAGGHCRQRMLFLGVLLEAQILSDVVSPT